MNPSEKAERQKNYALGYRQGRFYAFLECESRNAPISPLPGYVEGYSAGYRSYQEEQTHPNEDAFAISVED